MKKGIATLFLVFYFAATTGVVMNLHYCMNRIDSVQIGSVQSEICNTCGMPIDVAMGCCQNEVKVVKLSIDQQVKSVQYNFPSVKAINEFTSFSSESIWDAEESTKIFLAHSPPFREVPIYLKNRVFRL